MPRIRTAQLHGDRRWQGLGGGKRAALHGHVPEHPTPHAASTECFFLDVEDVPAASSALLIGWGFQRGAHQDPLPGKRDFRLGSGLTLGKLGLLLLDCSLLLLVRRIGLLLLVIVGILLLVVLLLLLLFFLVRFRMIGGLLLILAVRAHFDYGRWDAWVVQPVRCTPLWPTSWLPIVDKSRGSKSAEVQRVWEVYDERLQFMSRRDALLLDESLGLDDVSMALDCLVEGPAEAALADAYQFSGGPLPSRGLVLGRGTALFRWVQFGGPWVRRARANAADALDAADVFLYRDLSVAL